MYAGLRFDQLEEMLSIEVVQELASLIAGVSIGSSNYYYNENAGTDNDGSY